MNTYLIHEKFERVASQYSDKPAFIFQTDEDFDKYSFNQILQDSQRLAGFLKSFGLDSLSRVALYMENNPLWFSAYLAAISQNLSCVPIDYVLPKKEVANILIDSEAKLIFCSPSTFKNIKDIEQGPLQDIKVVTLGSEFMKSLGNIFQHYGTSSPANIASLLYTSGTTDNPKAVCLTHKNFMSNFYDIQKLNFYTDKDVFLCILPLHHCYPFMVNLIVPLLGGASVVFPKSLRADDILFCLKEKRVTIFVGVPQVFTLIYENLLARLKALKPLIALLGSLRRLSSLNLAKVLFFFVHRKIGPKLRYMVCGGAKFDRRISQGLFDLGFNVIEGYGLTETSPVVSFNRPKEVRIGSVGKTLSGVDLKIDNPDKDGQGEIIVKGDSVTEGYFRKPGLSEKSIKDGWFFTKDIGFVDKDGYLYITGRKDECIVLSSGKNIWPEELENVYSEAASIKELCIFDQGGRLYAVVVPQECHLEENQSQAFYEQIKKDIEQASLTLAPYKRIGGFGIIAQDLPRTRLGKLKRFLIKSTYAKEDIKKPKDESYKDLFSCDVIRIIGAFTDAKVTPESSLELDLGIDSLTKLQLISLLENKLQIRVPDEDLYQFSKVGELIEYLKKSKVSKEPLEYEELSWAQILGQKPPQSILRRISVSTSFFDLIFGLAAKAFLFSFFKLLYRVKIEGAQNIPKEGPYLVCSNHVSFFDGPLVFATFPFGYLRGLYFMGLSDYFDHPVFSWMVKPGRIIPINANKNLKQALNVSSFLLARKKSLCIFPEGQRSKTGELIEFRKGVAILARELNLKIVPVAISGAFKAWPVAKKFPRISKIKILYGEPIEPSQVVDAAGQDVYEKIIQALRDRIGRLLVEK